MSSGAVPGELTDTTDIKISDWSDDPHPSRTLTYVMHMVSFIDARH